MNCPNCNEPLREGAQFCTRCGARTGAAAAGEGSPASLSTVETAGGGAGEEVFEAGDSLVGRVLDGKYEIIAPLGSGGMGSVYRARRVLIGDEVAVKVLLRQFVADSGLVERFRREARAAAALRHPNVVAIYDYGEARNEDAPAYIVMELVEGESLRELLRREGRLRPERAIALMRDICAGVGAAHRRQIFHRDLKPDNVIVLPADEDRERETVKVVDFGIAKLRDAAGAPTLTQTGMIIGTPHYMSPEQCRGEELNARSDVYSLGAMLYEMLAGVPPFLSSSMMGVLTKHITEAPPPLPQETGASPALVAVIMRALAKDPDARPADAASLSRELRAAEKSAIRQPNAKETSPTVSSGVSPASVETVVRAPAPAISNRIGMEFVWIPPGSFMMGSEKYDNEKPVHRVTFNEGFYMGKYEVTQAQWQGVMGNNPSWFKGCDNCPVEGVSWDDAQAFTNKLNAMGDGYKYRLPTEAEWEYACRAGTTSDYAGDLDAMAWYSANSDNKTHPVGQKQPNAFGLFDMHGNVWEWCQDYYHSNYDGAPRGGSAWLSGGDSTLRVLRGGSWDLYAAYCRSASRSWGAPAVRHYAFGSRLVAVPRT